MRIEVRRAALFLVLVAVSCGGESTDPTPVTTTTTTQAPAPVPTSIGFVSSIPDRGGVIHAGLPANHDSGVTNGLTMTFNAVSDADRTVRFVLVVEGPRNGVCLWNDAPGGVPAAPVVEMRRYVPVQVTVRELLLTSVCRYPSEVDMVTVRLMPEDRLDRTPIYEAKLGARYTIVE